MNDEIVRGVYGCEFDRRRPESLELQLAAFLPRLDPDVRFESDSHEPSARVIRGPAGVKQMLESAPQMWDSYRYELSQVEIVDEQRVLACGTVHACPRGNGTYLALPFANVWTLRDGKAVRIESYADRAAALAALRS